MEKDKKELEMVLPNLDFSSFNSHNKDKNLSNFLTKIIKNK